MLTYLEDSEDVKVGVTELQDLLSIKQIACTAGNERERPKFSGEEKKSYALPLGPDGTCS